MSTLPQVLRHLEITIHSKPAPLPAHLKSNLRHGGTSWHVTLSRKVYKQHGSGKGPFQTTSTTKSLSTPYFMGSARKGEPVLADVVSSLLGDMSTAGETFDSFCREFIPKHFSDCIDEDTGRPLKSCNCRKIWTSIETKAPKVRKFFGKDLEAVQEAAQDY